jgi:hypothetical protein
VTYNPPPLLIRLAPINVSLPEIGDCSAESDATVFDFGAVNVTIRVRFQLRAEQLSCVANTIAEPSPLVAQAREAIQALYDQLLPAIKNPA